MSERHGRKLAKKIPLELVRAEGLLIGALATLRASASTLGLARAAHKARQAVHQIEKAIGTPDEASTGSEQASPRERFWCPAIDRTVTLSECVTNLTHHLEEPCTAQCEMGCHNAKLLGVSLTSELARKDVAPASAYAGLPL